MNFYSLINEGNTFFENNIFDKALDCFMKANELKNNNDDDKSCLYSLIAGCKSKLV